MTETVKGYRFVTNSLCSENGNIQWKIGEWIKIDGSLSLCHNGLHACRNPWESLSYVFGERWFTCEAQGEILEDEDKFCAREMRILKEIPVSVIHQWMVDCAYRVLHFFEEKHPEDKRPREALEAKQRWVDEPTEENRAAAWDARAAAWAAAWDAARAARAAAWDAEDEWQQEHLNELIKEVIE